MQQLCAMRDTDWGTHKAGRRGIGVTNADPTLRSRESSAGRIVCSNLLLQNAPCQCKRQRAREGLGSGRSHSLEPEVRPPRARANPVFPVALAHFFGAQTAIIQFTPIDSQLRSLAVAYTEDTLVRIHEERGPSGKALLERCVAPHVAALWLFEYERDSCGHQLVDEGDGGVQ